MGMYSLPSFYASRNSRVVGSRVLDRLGFKVLCVIASDKRPEDLQRPLRLGSAEIAWDYGRVGFPWDLEALGVSPPKTLNLIPKHP